MNKDREKIDIALKEIKELKKVIPFAYKRFPNHFAMCYSPAFLHNYEWENQPYYKEKFVCSCCGKEFGINSNKMDTMKEMYDYFDFNKEYKISVKTGAVDDIKNFAIKLEEIGYDVKIEYHCSKCIEDKGLPPMVVKLRKRETDKYKITYPDVCNIHESIRMNVTFTPLWYYDVTKIFLKQIISSNEEVDIRSQIVLWFKNLEKSISFEGYFYNDLLRAIELILSDD